MGRVSVNYADDFEEKITQRACQKKITLSAYARHLTELGLRIEELSEKNEANADKADPTLEAINQLKKLQQKSFLASQEALYLVRYLTSRVKEKTPHENEKMLEIAKVQSKTRLETITEE